MHVVFVTATDWVFFDFREYLASQKATFISHFLFIVLLYLNKILFLGVSNVFKINYLIKLHHEENYFSTIIHYSYFI